MLQRVRIKICGLRDPLQAAKIAQMGADAIGLVMAPSPRWVSPEQARAVTDQLPPLVWAVGVFADSPPETINAAVRRSGIHVVQLHGQEKPELVEALERPCIKAFAMRDANWIDSVRNWLDGVKDHRRLLAILLDAYKSDARGGTGQRFNWEWVLAARAKRQLEGLPPLVLSGGLDAGVVGDAIDIVQPWAVDVSSGVESAPGIKDLNKVADFIQATREGSPLRSEFWIP